ncbi:ABC transporter permease [Verrucomicrobium spinosum]|uniref:ABC transporter permease n=1 Tax=Verrucomicrobium spinosum TaxID=2736 RepID=UPI0001745EAE|nr:ABC transporter permease [Verrucomicrobium spinosum]
MTLFLIQWGAELRKMLSRKRTFIGFGAFLLLEAVLLYVFKRDGSASFFRRIISRQGEAFESYFSALTLAFLIVASAVFILGAIYITLVAGDVVAKESEDGNLRLLLARPISRLRLLVLKFLSCIVYSWILIQFIAWSALGLGVALQGWGGGLFVFAPDQGVLEFYNAADGLYRYALASVALSLSMSLAACVAFFFSCWRIKPSAATITALSYLLIDMIVKRGKFMESYKHLLMTSYMESWVHLYAERIPWALLLRNYSILAGVGLTLFVLGVLVFESRDLKS